MNPKFSDFEASAKTGVFSVLPSLIVVPNARKLVVSLVWLTLGVSFSIDY